MAQSFIYFKILQDIELPFAYSHFQKDIYRAEAGQAGIDTAEVNEVIEIVDWHITDDVHAFHGNPEPIYNDNVLNYVHPSKDGQSLVSKRFGEYECVRCGYINYVSLADSNGSIKEPFECMNDVCGRKGPFKPLFPKDILKPIWKLSNAPVSAPAYEIYIDIYNYIKDHLILKNDEYHLMTLWIMASWLVDDFSTAPYLLFIAPKSSGKTQALSVLHELGYRSYLTVSVTAAAIFRASDLWQILPLIDESEFQVNTDKPSESSQALYGILNGGYKRGNCALRIEGDNRIPTSFNIFGFKAVASTKVFLPTLESRSIIINMSQGMPDNILIDEDRSKIIRSKLLYFRFSTLNKLKIIIPKSNSGRITELFIPLVTTAQVLKDLDGTTTIIKYDDLMTLLERTMRSMETDRKNEEGGTAEALVVHVLCDLMVPGITSILPKTIAQELHWCNQDDEKDVRRASQRVGYILKTLGIKTKKENGGNIINFEDEGTINRINELKQRYILP